MKLERPHPGRLVVIHDDTRWTRGFLLGGILFLGLAGFTLALEARHSERLTGSLVGAGLCGVVFLIFYERSVFEVERGLGRITWRRRLSLGERRGVIALGDVQAVVVQNSPAQRVTPRRRVALLTKDGAVPISRTFFPDGGECDEVAAALREAIGLPAEAYDASRTT